MIDSRSSSISPAPSALKQAIHLGFFIGSGCGLAIGSIVSILLGHNLLWQAGGLLVGSLLGICGGAAFAWLYRRMKPATASVYRPTGS